MGECEYCHDEEHLEWCPVVRIRELEAERDVVWHRSSPRKLQIECDRLRGANAELRRVASILLEAHMDGYNLSGDEIDDAYAALEGEVHGDD